MPHSSKYVGRGWGFAWMEGEEPAEELKGVLPRGLLRDELVAQLIEAAGELVRKQIYEDPHAETAHAPGNALYCSECNRYGVVGGPIGHATSCVAGRVSDLIMALRRPVVLTDRERALADLRKASAPEPKPTEAEQGEPQWKKCPQCARENSLDAWQKFGMKCPSCGDLYEKESEQVCSSVAPHGSHTFGGRPMRYCPGIPEPKPEPSGVSAFFGKWPGNETDAELLTALDEVRKPEPHIEYEVEEHPWASEEGNAPALRGLDSSAYRIVSMTHEEAARRAAGLEVEQA